MGIQVYRDISIDFSNSRYIIINAKQHDFKSRFIRMTCTNVGQKVELNPNDYSAFIRYRKSDGYGVFNKCIISTNGQVIFELTEQMLSTIGTSYADLVILDVNKSDINSDLTIISADGRIIENNGSLCSTMSFYINIMEKPLDDYDIESTNEFSALNELLLKASTDYEYLSTVVMTQTEDYMNTAKTSEQAAAVSASQAKTSENNTKQYATNAKTSETNAKTSETNSKKSETNAKQSETNAKSSEQAAATSESNAQASENKAKASESNALSYEQSSKQSYQNVMILQKQAEESANAAKDSEEKILDEMIAAYNSAVLAKSYTMGASGDLSDDEWNKIVTDNDEYFPMSTRENEDTENAKYYYEQSKDFASNAKTSETNAKQSETNAKSSEQAAATSESNAKTSETHVVAIENNLQNVENNASTSANNAKQSELNAKASEQSCTSSVTQIASYVTSVQTSEQNAKKSETNTKISEANAKNSEDIAVIKASEALNSQTAAKASENNAKASELAAQNYRKDVEDYAKVSRSYAVGDTDLRQGEASDCAKYYYEQSKQISEGLNGALLPMGTITFAQLSIQPKVSGYMYNISDDFVSDSTFKDGGNIPYSAGTNVYYTADGYWDCLAGFMVTGVKGNNETAYRKGNVNLTPDDIGTYSKLEIDNNIDNVNAAIEQMGNSISEDLQKYQESVDNKIENINNDITQNINTKISELTTLITSQATIIESLSGRIKVLEELIESGDITTSTKIVDSEGNVLVTNNDEQLIISEET